MQKGLHEDFFKEANKKILKEEGEEFQIDLCIEEMGELIKALCKFKRKNKNVTKQSTVLKEEVIEELADVRNMIGILENIFGEEKVLEIRRQKIERTLNLFK